jgi:hypothetical protein
MMAASRGWEQLDRAQTADFRFLSSEKKEGLHYSPPPAILQVDGAPVAASEALRSSTAFLI